MSLLDILAWIVLLVLVAGGVAIFFIMGRPADEAKNMRTHLLMAAF